MRIFDSIAAAQAGAELYVGSAPHEDVERYLLTIDLIGGLSQPAYAVDIGTESSFTRLLRRVYPDLKILNTRDCDFNKDELEFASGCADVVFHFEVLEHLLNPEWHLKECHRILNPDGRMYLTTPCGALPAALWSPSHFHEMTDLHLRALLKASGFTIVRFRRFNRSLLSYVRHGLLRPVLRWLFGGYYFVEVAK